MDYYGMDSWRAPESGAPGWRESAKPFDATAALGVACISMRGILDSSAGRAAICACKIQNGL